MLHIYLLLEIEQQWIEIQVSKTASFYRIMKALYEMRVIDIAHVDALVYERETLMQCDGDVALSHLNVIDGMVFLVY